MTVTLTVILLIDDNNCVPKLCLISPGIVFVSSCSLILLKYYYVSTKTVNKNLSHYLDFQVRVIILIIMISVIKLLLS